MKNLLLNGLANGNIVETDRKEKLTIGGLTKVYPVYQIKLQCLFYNDQNDRIATWVSKYKTTNNVDRMNLENICEYNELVQKFIEESDLPALKKTMRNIADFGQLKAGVVLKDGRIVDGNRRFTCLRNLAKENEKYNYFEAVILDKEIGISEKEIKMLELFIQHGEDDKIGYNPIDRLVGIYNDIIEKKLLTVEEYARSTNEKESELLKKIEQAELLVEFLEFINAPKQFYIARDLSLDSPIMELANILRKCKDDDIKESTKNVIFANFLMKPNDDMTRFIRKIKSVIDSDYLESFLEEQMEIADEVISIIPVDNIISTQYINDKIRTNVNIKDQLERSMDKAELQAKKTATIDEPFKLIEKSLMTLESVDINIFDKMDSLGRKRVKNRLSILIKLAKELEEYAEDTLC